ncbi:class I glutamine amidotransferase-like protein [Diaporthe sp. PMI_573]|nr:class I glutamine amidotransferase-like protein [Diaporthaceae sp. PMI_573]
MALGARCLRVAMLNADTSVPNVYANLGTFGDILHRKLLAAADRTPEQLKIVHSVYNVVMGEYPDSLDDLDAVFITASAASSYEIAGWIKRLEEYVVTLYTRYPEIKLFGSCFGHHIICQALLKDHGVAVAKRPSGWEIGVSEVKFTDEFRDAFARRVDRSVPKSAYLEFVHADEVILAPKEPPLPKPWILLGTTEHCKVPGVYQPGRVLTLQGHFEFDTFKSQETMRIFGADEASASNPKSIDISETGNTSGPVCDDGEAVVGMLVHFLTEEWDVTGVGCEKFPAMPTYQRHDSHESA